MIKNSNGNELGRNGEKNSRLKKDHQTCQGSNSAPSHAQITRKKSRNLDQHCKSKPNGAEIQLSTQTKGNKTRMSLQLTPISLRPSPSLTLPPHHPNLKIQPPPIPILTPAHTQINKYSPTALFKYQASPNTHHHDDNKSPHSKTPDYLMKEDFIMTCVDSCNEGHDSLVCLRE